ncbi:MAG: prepilin-type N-terminal cleavage/methylation domain-containing protein [Pseudomonadota bacterium]
MMRRRAGFTLVELLVAISILAIVAVLGWRGLDTIVRARSALVQDMEQTRGLQLAFAQLQSDCAQIAGSGELPTRQTLVAQSGSLTLIRTIAFDGQPSQFEVVAYRFKDGGLTRSESASTRDLTALDAMWDAVLKDTDSNPQITFQTDVLSMSIQAYQNGGWVGAVPAVERVVVNNNSAAITAAVSIAPAPTALEVDLRLKGRDAGIVKAFLVGSI